MSNSSIINQFYTSFAEHNAEAMVACYHDDIVFEDPAFGILEGDRAKSIWKMLLESGSGELELTYSDVWESGDTGGAKWIAKYPFGSKNRPVVNHITAKLKFQNGKIIDHRDDFDLWKWSRQALGFGGTLLGWSPIIKNKINQVTKQRLDAYILKNG